jgi:hypothetical protein
MEYYGYCGSSQLLLTQMQMVAVIQQLNSQISNHNHKRFGLKLKSKSSEANFEQKGSVCGESKNSLSSCCKLAMSEFK